MASKKKRKTLPKDFRELLKSTDLAALQQVFETCEIEAYDSAYSKQTALLMPDCPDSLARWLVAQGANINATDYYGCNALHIAAHSSRDYSLLIELGCGVHARNHDHETPLHSAVSAKHLHGVQCLLAAGADVHATNREGLTPLESALRGCSNIEIVRMVEVARVLLAAGARKTPAMDGFVTRIGKNFEFHRAGFNKDWVEATDAGLVALCQLFAVTPPERRVMHDGHSVIVVGPGSWKHQFQKLWEFLVPSRGAAQTLQGEVIRISGRISGEIVRNGGGNWDSDFTQMARTFVKFVQQGTPLEDNAVRELENVVNQIIKRRGDDIDSSGYERLEEYAVEWVRRNPKPMKLGPAAYSR